MLVTETSGISVKHQHRYRTFRQARYDINTDTGHLCRFSTKWIPVPPVPVQTFKTVPDTWVGSVPHESRCQTLRYVLYSINDGTGHFGKIGTTETPVPDTLVSSVRHQYGHPLYRYGRLNRICYRYRYNIDAGTGQLGMFASR